MDARRVVQVWARDAERRWAVGSGYLLSDSVLVTATHHLGPGPPAPDDPVVHSRVEPAWRSAVTEIVDLGGDVSLVSCATPRPGPSGPTPRIGRFGTTAGQVDAVVVGFPRCAVQRPAVGRAESPLYRRQTQIPGEITTATGFDDGSVTVQLDPAHVPPRPPDLKASESIFGGLSGAAVFVGDHLVGVVTEDPHPDRPTTLVGARLDRRFRVTDDAPDTGLLALIRTVVAPERDLPDVSATAHGRAIRAAHRREVQTIAGAIPDRLLRGRGEELLRMARFSTAPGPGYLVWQAQEWSGKSALLATFALEPPKGVDVISFFADKNSTRASSGDAYLNSVTAQLLAYLDEPPEAAAGGAGAGPSEGHHLELLARAARTAADDGRHLVLMVDALDEDVAFTPQRAGETPIAALLPADIDALRVIVSTRAYDDVLTAPRAGHPLRTTTALQLTTSPHATDVRDEAERELRVVTTGDTPVHLAARRILGYLVAAGGALGAADLASMINDAHPDTVTTRSVQSRLRSDLHRVVRRRRREENSSGGDDDPDTFEWAHETLPATARRELGAQFCRGIEGRLTEWAARQRSDGWTSDTPAYLETGYTDLLRRVGDAAALGSYALDADRHDWLRTRTGSDDQALREIAEAENLLREQSPRDVTRLVCAAFERRRLLDRSSTMPIRLPAVWFRLGRVRHAEALIRVMPPHIAHQAQGAVVATLIAAGDCIGAERVARSIAVRSSQSSSLADVVHALIDDGDVDGATRVARSISRSSSSSSEALADVARALVLTGRLDAAERLADTSGDAHVAAEVAVTLASTGLLVEAERIGINVADAWDQARALAATAVARIEAGDVAGSERLVHVTTHPVVKILLLTACAAALTGVGRNLDALRLAGDAGELVHLVDDPRSRSVLTTGVAVALADAGAVVPAGELARSVTSFGDTQTDAVTAVAQALVRSGHGDAAEELVRHGSDELTTLLGLGAVADEMASVRDFDGSERVARAIDDTYLRAASLSVVAIASADAGLVWRARGIADHIDGSEPFAKAAASVAVARGLLDAGDADGAAAVVREVAASHGWSTPLGDALGGLVDAGHGVDAEDAARSINDAAGRSAALTAVAAALLDRGGATDAERLATDAESLAGSVVDRAEGRSSAFSSLATALTAAGRWVDAERAATHVLAARAHSAAMAAVAHAAAERGHLDDARRLASGAERVALGIRDAAERATSLVAVAGAFVDSLDLGEAERVARSIGQPCEQVVALGVVAQALAGAGDTLRAGEVAAAAARDAALLAESDSRATALRAAVSALTSVGELGEAERVARTIPPGYDWVQALLCVARAQASAGDAAGAQRVARSVADPFSRTVVFEAVAGALAEAGALGQAEQVARGLVGRYEQSVALAAVVRALAGAHDVEQARLVADSITGSVELRSESLCVVATAAAAGGSMIRAQQLALEAEGVARTLDTGRRSDVLATVVGALAGARLVDDAERVSRSIDTPAERAKALVAVADSLVGSGDLSGAERVACELLDGPQWLAAIRVLTSLDRVRLQEVESYLEGR